MGGGTRGEEEERPVKQGSEISSSLRLLAEVSSTFLGVACHLQLGDGTFLLALILSKSAELISACNAFYPKFVCFFFGTQHSRPWWCILYAKSRFTSRSV